MKPLPPGDRVPSVAGVSESEAIAIAKADAYQRIASAVTHWRRVRRLSQTALAARSGLSDRTIRRVEHQQTPLRIDTLTALARGLGVPVERLVERR